MKIESRFIIALALFAVAGAALAQDKVANLQAREQYAYIKP